MARKKQDKKPRGGIGCLVADGESNTAESSSSHIRTEIVPLSRAFEFISNISCNEDQNGSVNNDEKINNRIIDNQRQRRVRIVYPYPYTFATFAKARWIGRTVVDIYNDEFGELRRYLAR
jgi:hypothetical protein